MTPSSFQISRTRDCPGHALLYSASSFKSDAVNVNTHIHVLDTIARLRACSLRARM